jgi:hypothetical protein
LLKSSPFFFQFSFFNLQILKQVHLSNPSVYLKSLEFLSKKNNKFLQTSVNTNYKRFVYTIFKNFNYRLESIFFKNAFNSVSFTNFCFGLFNSGFNVFVYTENSLNNEYSSFFYFKYGYYYYHKYITLFRSKMSDKFKWKYEFSQLASELNLFCFIVLTDNIPIHLFGFVKSCNLTLLVTATPAFFHKSVDFFFYVNKIDFDVKFIILYLLYAAFKLKLNFVSLELYNKYLLFQLKSRIQ